MAATIQIHELTTDATTGVDKTSGTVRFKLANNTTVDASDPMVVPGAGSDHSYTKKLRAYMEAPPDTQISDMAWYSDGSNGFGTGVTCTAKNLGTTFGTQNDSDHSGTDFFTYTSGSPLDGDGTDTGPFVPGDDDSYIGDIVEFQLHVASTASNGSLTPETVTLSWVEI